MTVLKAATPTGELGLDTAADPSLAAPHVEHDQKEKKVICRKKRKTWVLQSFEINSLTETKAGVSFLEVTCGEVRGENTPRFWTEFQVHPQLLQQLLHYLFHCNKQQCGQRAAAPRGSAGCSGYVDTLYLCHSNTITTKRDQKSFLGLRCHQCSELVWRCCWTGSDAGISPRSHLLNVSSWYTAPCCTHPATSSCLALSTNHKEEFRGAPYLFLSADHSAPLNKDKRFPYVIGILFVIFNLMAGRICARWHFALTRQLQEVTFPAVILALGYVMPIHGFLAGCPRVYLPACICDSSRKYRSDFTR